MKLPKPARRSTLKIAEQILSAPTAPYHEHRVRATLLNILRIADIPAKLDRYGNLIAHYKRGKAPPISLAAHMDHPGVELVSVKGDKARARWNGQTPAFNLRGLRLALWADGPEGRRGTARVMDGDGRLPRKIASRLTLRVPRTARPGDFGYADLTPFRISGQKIISKAHDNLGGCAAITAALLHLARHKVPADVTALYTRSEEVGFIGAAGAIRAGSISKSRPLIILECSKAMPGAEMGKGPVIRIGDRLRIFDGDLATACEQAAEKLAKQRPGFLYQRRLMDGGACEASLFELSGYRTLCFAFPLGNYHNIGPRGVQAEYINLRDFLNGVDCLAAFSAFGLNPTAARKGLIQRMKKHIGRAGLKRLAGSVRP